MMIAELLKQNISD